MVKEEEREIQQMTIRVPRDVHEALKTLARATDASSNEVVLRAIRDYLGTKGHRQAVERFLGEAQSQYRVALDKLADL